MKVVIPPMMSREMLDAVTSQARSQDRFEVGLRAGAREVEVGFAQGVDERANHVRAADGDAAGGADVGAEPIEEDDLTIEEDDGDLRPVFGVRGPPPPLLRT